MWSIGSWELVTLSRTTDKENNFYHGLIVRKKIPMAYFWLPITKLLNKDPNTSNTKDWNKCELYMHLRKIYAER